MLHRNDAFHSWMERVFGAFAVVVRAEAAAGRGASGSVAERRVGHSRARCELSPHRKQLPRTS